MAQAASRIRQFHEEVPVPFIRAVLETMNQASHHTFQVLTKRPGRVLEVNGSLTWSPNIWLGTSIESQRWQFRLEQLRATGARTKFLSLEPLLGPLPDIPIQGIDWVIVGVGAGNQGLLSTQASAFLLQAVGWRIQKANGTDTRWADMESDANALMRKPYLNAFSACPRS